MTGRTYAIGQRHAAEIVNIDIAIAICFDLMDVKFAMQFGCEWAMTCKKKAW